MTTRRTVAAALGAAALALTVVAAPTAQAAQQPQELTCDGVQLTVRIPNQNSKENGGFSAGQVLMGGTGHLIPTSFTVGLKDATKDFWVFGPETTLKGGGMGNHNQASITCTQEQVATASDLGGELPPGVEATDVMHFDLTVTAVAKP